MVVRQAGGVLPGGLAEAISATAEEIAAVLRGAPGADAAPAVPAGGSGGVGPGRGSAGRSGSPDVSGLPVPRSTWTVGEAAAHLAQANALMADLAAGHERPYGDGTPGSLAEANERALAGFAERAPGPLAALITERAAAFLAAVEDRDPDDLLVTPLGTMRPAVLGSYLLTHMLGHGYDLALALGRPHMLDAHRVGLTLPFMLQAMPRVTDPAAVAGLTARFAVRLRGGAGFGVVVTDGAVEVTHEPPARPDCTILTDPVAFLLLGLGRVDPWPVIARGKALGWGRKPWLAPRFPRLFRAP
ncbi:MULTISPECIES: maleylpyruvate isomerase family mycothiol-dependent enzyme [unclassified Streptomyces]|uniref:maleylpyruvate isomerase family mycothiol-dependent enzyme n=1 Tax=unclassified Streptomyces TaxID=2593676 RepID=UPI0006FA0DEC|nr:MULTISPECIES: maleylpyruvate isomerase family mycothiol-dependent enzyme [unclassified Streptomyces]KQX49888.1 sterol-binding protein [Streptomyces sp. Root1304]KRA80069.1 sterol-binding protein [Streptomyces sp. Root66D1]